MVDISNGGEFSTGIVGESYYQEAIKQCYNDPRHQKNDMVCMEVTLLLEDSNPYDNKAVAVISPYGKIGYLSKKFARRYRKDYGQSLTVKARIFSRTGTLFGVWVDLPYDGDGFQSSSRRSTNSKLKKQSSILRLFKKIIKR